MMRRETTFCPAFCDRPRFHPAGISVLDLLISISLVGLLLSLLVPAVQQARERARQVACKNNLRQLATAAHAHLSSHRTFPYTSTVWSDNTSQYLAISPHRHLTAFLDPNVFDQVDFQDPTTPGWTLGRPDFFSGSNRMLSRVAVPVFACPSDSVTQGSVSYRANLGISVELLPPSDSIEEIAQRGAFVNGRAVRPAEFSHGMSNTALFSERVTGDERSESFDPFRDIFAVTRLRGDQSTASMDRICQQTASTQPEAEFSFQGATWLLGGYSNTWYNHVRTPNSVHPDCAMGPKIVDGGPSILSARSLHPGGVNVMMADASVTFTSSSIDGNVWKALGTRNGPSD